MRLRQLNIRTTPIILMAMLLAACAAPAASPAAQTSESPSEAAPEAVTITMVRQPFLTNAAIAIAYEEGFFREQGIEIEFIDLEHSSSLFAALVQGQIDVIGAPANAGLFNLMAEGEQIAIVGDRSYVPTETDCGTPAVLARQTLLDSGELAEPADLKGLTISADTGEFS